MGLWGEVAQAQRQLIDVVDALAAAVSGASDAELVAVLTGCETASRRLDRLTVATLADLQRRGVFAEHGYRTPVGALSDLLGWERFEARRRVIAAEQVCDRAGLDGAVAPAQLPATAAVFAAGGCTLRHVETITKILGTDSAARLAPDVWTGAEAQLATKAGEYTPSELHTWGTALIETLDQDGAAPDDHEPAPVNELYLLRRGAGGGKITGRFDDAALFDAIATAVDAKAKPTTGDDTRSVPQRQAEALAEVCGHVLDHGDLPRTGGRRPHLNVLIRLEDLEDRARAAMLDFGDTLTPAALRALACDAAIIPIVLGGQDQPLDVGRATRTIPDGLRRAITARDHGCAHPGCDRPPSWSECHHIIAWEHGGSTSLDNLVMLCRAHHRQLHHTDWTVRIRNGHPRVHPPAVDRPTTAAQTKPQPQLTPAA